MEKLHVVVGRGPLGRSVVKELLIKGKKVRVIGKSNKKSGFPQEVEEITYDVSQKEQAKEAFHDADIVYQCVAPAYNEWTKLFPGLTAGIIEGASYNNAKLVVGDNLYMYGDVPETLKESLPYKATTGKGIVRADASRELLKAHETGKIKVAIGRGSDFFGPYATNSIIGRLFPNIVEGKKVYVIGDPDQLHTYTFIEDFGKALVILGENEEAFGQVWHVPNAKTVTTRQFLTLAYEEAGEEPKIKSMGRNMLKLGGLFNPNAKGAIELLYQSEKPFVVDNSKFVQAFGDCSTPLKESIRQTILYFKNNKS